MKRIKSKEGFTLMEVAIAVAVVVIGVLALFALIGTGLDMSAKAIADTHAGMFANNVLGGLRAVSVQKSDTGVPGEWENFWENFRKGSEDLSVAAPDAWVNGSGANSALRIWGDGSLRTIVYRNEPLHDADTTNIVNIALRYRCNVGSIFDSPTGGGRGGQDPIEAPFPNVLWTNRAAVTLKVWEGEFGSVKDEDALVFYSEFDNPGDL